MSTPRRNDRRGPPPRPRTRTDSADANQGYPRGPRARTDSADANQGYPRGPRARTDSGDADQGYPRGPRARTDGGDADQGYPRGPRARTDSPDQGYSRGPRARTDSPDQGYSRGPRARTDGGDADRGYSRGPRDERRGDPRDERRGDPRDERRGDPRDERRSQPRDPRLRAERRALTNVGGPSILTGDPDAAALLATALDVQGSLTAEESARAHVHGFHSYPARMHPETARRLVEALSRPGDRVLDPFCGSGTVLVEARIAGRAALGVDANPLAVRLARLKASGSTEGERARLVAEARKIAAHADDRRKARAGASRRYGPEDMALFDAHVLLELDSLRTGLDAIDNEALRADLELVFSAILTKISRRTSDTSEHEQPRRIAGGYPARLFIRKAEELARLLAEVAPALEAAPPALVEAGDARVLRGVAPASIDLVVTSPPYPGVYDYLAHHEARLRWLRLPRDLFDDAEIGARRHLDPLGSGGGQARWQAELHGVLTALARVLRPGAPAVLLLADSVIAGAPVYALDVLGAAAPAAGLKLHAAASQDRPHFHIPTARAFAERPRREHAILLTRAERPERSERAERPARPERPARSDYAERAERAERPARPERPERSARPDYAERPARPERSARPDYAERPARPERPAGPEHAERPAGAEGPEAPAAPERPKRRIVRPAGAERPEPARKPKPRKRTS